MVEREGREAPCQTAEIPLGMPADDEDLEPPDGACGGGPPGRMARSARLPVRARRAPGARRRRRAPRARARRSSRATPTCSPRRRSPRGSSRRARSPTCSFAGPGLGSGRAPAPHRRLGDPGRRGDGGRARMGRPRASGEEAEAWPEAAPPRGSTRRGLDRRAPRRISCRRHGGEARRPSSRRPARARGGARGAQVPDASPRPARGGDHRARGGDAGARAAAEAARAEGARPERPGVRPSPSASALEDTETEDVVGVLEVTPQRYGFLRFGGLEARARRRLRLGVPDPPLRASLRRRGRRARPARRDAASAIGPSSTSTGSTAASRQPRSARAFDDLTPVLPQAPRGARPSRRDVLTRAVDLLAPLALGQRVLVRAAPRSGPHDPACAALAQALIAARGGPRADRAADRRAPGGGDGLARGAAGAEIASATAELRARGPGAGRRARARAGAAAGRGRQRTSVLIVDSLSRLAVASTRPGAESDVAEVKRLFGSGRELGRGRGGLADRDRDGGRRGRGRRRRRARRGDDRELADHARPRAGRRRRRSRRCASAECAGLQRGGASRCADELAAIRRLRSLLADLDPAEAANARFASGSRARASNAELLESNVRLAPVGEASPGGLAGELDRLGVALGLHVAEALRLGVEDDVELALLDPLVQPGAPEDEPADPVHEAAAGRADQLGPVLVDVLAERGGGLARSRRSPPARAGPEAPRPPAPDRRSRASPPPARPAGRNPPR